MRILRRLIPASLLVLALLTGCGEDQQSSSKNQAPESGGNTASGDGFLLAKLANWPSIEEQGKNSQASVVSLNPLDFLAQNYYIVLDSSGSMREKACGGSGESKSNASKRALDEFAQSVPENANLGLLVFEHDSISERVPLGKGSANRKTFVRYVKDAGPDGGTPLHNAIGLAYKKLEEQARKQLGYGEYHLVVVTDGEADFGQNPKQIVNHILGLSPVVIRTVGFCIGSDHSLNQPGRIVYKEAFDFDSLRKGLQEVLAESLVFDVKEFK